MRIECPVLAPKFAELVCGFKLWHTSALEICRSEASLKLVLNGACAE